MDLGIKGRKAIVCASSKGLGRACAEHLAAAGVDLVLNARTRGPLEETAKYIRDTYAVKVTPVAADVTTADGQDEIFAACPAPDILVNNAAGPPAGDFRDWDREDWHLALDGNMLAPIEMIRRSFDGMIDRKFGRIVNITSAAVKSPFKPLGLSNGARAGLTGFVAGIARDGVAHNVTINNILPGLFATDRMTSLLDMISTRDGISEQEAIDMFAHSFPAGRLGDPDEFGALCAFVCSARAGYITGQNLLIDGGDYPGTF
ncbi:SDR family oxidoreductase [Emcibacter sp.]|uniref:SDR family oxidoreductase n=1 Tax=Emcibacter sp. TaxID=1979954 RepID=UPI003A8FD5DB